MEETKLLSFEDVREMKLEELDNKAMIFSNGMVRLADLPKHGSAAIVMVNEKYDRVKYEFTTK